MSSVHEQRVKHLLGSSIWVIGLVSSVVFGDEVLDTVEQGDNTPDCSSFSDIPDCLPNRW
jgi:hypothetical protein